MDDEKLLHSIPAIMARLPKMSRQELVNIWGHGVDIQAQTKHADLRAAIERLLDAIDAEFAKPRSGGDFLEIGPLGFLGYHVGHRAAIPAHRRQARLSAIFRRPIPAVFPPSYRAGWGEPATAKRLQRMATTIAGFIRDPRWRKNETMEDAIAEWTEDLSYLHHRHYRGEFPWPGA